MTASFGKIALLRYRKKPIPNGRWKADTLKRDEAATARCADPYWKIVGRQGSFTRNFRVSPGSLVRSEERLAAG